MSDEKLAAREIPPEIDGEPLMQPMTLERVCAIARKAHDQVPDDREWLEAELLKQLRELPASPLSASRECDEPICSGCYAVRTPNGGILVLQRRGELMIYGNRIEAEAELPKGCTLMRVDVWPSPSSVPASVGATGDEAAILNEAAHWLENLEGDEPSTVASRAEMVATIRRASDFLAGRRGPEDGLLEQVRTILADDAGTNDAAFARIQRALEVIAAGRRGPDEEVDIEALEMADHEAQARRIVSRGAETGDAARACVNCGRSLADHTNAEPYTCPEFTVSTTRATSDQTATPLCASNAGARVEYRVVPATTSRIAKRIQYDEFPRILRRYADALQDIDWPGGIVGVTVLDEVADLLEEIARSARAATPAEASREDRKSVV